MKLTCPKCKLGQLLPQGTEHALYPATGRNNWISIFKCGVCGYVLKT